ESDASLQRQVGPPPFTQHSQAVPKTDEPENMNDEPYQPGEETSCLDAADFRHGRAAADGRHVSVVVVAERLRRLTTDCANHVVRGTGALLFRHLRDARQPAAVLLQRTQITRDENLGVAR